jgi:DNA excision repair protein ERCC-6
LIRKGVLTPFHKLKGFERRLQQPGQSNRHNVLEKEDKSNDLIAASVARAIRSMSEAAHARPTTKLLDPEALPKLDAPTRPFQRLKTPLKFPQSPEREVKKKKDSQRKKKTKRPLPDRKWTKLISYEEKHLEESGMFSILFMLGTQWFSGFSFSQESVCWCRVHVFQVMHWCLGF